MNAVPLIASLSDLGGPDIIVILFVLLFWGAVIGGIILLVRFLARRKICDHGTAQPEERLQKLDSMRSAGLINDTEYQEQRRRILSEI